MCTTLPAVRCLILFACTAASAFAQDKPPVVETTQLAVSSQGKDKTAVDIVVALRHAPPAEAKCANASCGNADHWLVEVRTAAGKPVTLAMAQQKESEKELRAAAAPKAKKVGEAMISEATLLLRVPVLTPYALVQQMVMTAATAGLHKIEFAVAASGAAAAEKSLPVPLPVDEGATEVVEDDAKAKLEEIRIALHLDQATGQVRRVFAKNNLKDDVHLRELIKAATADFARLGRPNEPVVIDAASAVPWKEVVAVIDVVRSAGVKDVRFAAPSAKK